MVVIAIISILVTVGIVSYQKTLQLSRDSRRKADLEQIRQALETYRSENDTYPSTLSALTPDYISSLPTDPKGGSYIYQPGTSPITSYYLCTYLETSSGTTSCTNTCGPNGESCNYQVTNP